MFLVVGMFEILLGIPLLYEKVKTNWIYGFRIKKTLENEEIWYKANKYSGRDLIISGSVVVIFSLFIIIFKDNLDIGAVGLLGGCILLVSIIIVLIRGLIYIKNL